jgi:hypothetical protein
MAYSEIIHRYSYATWAPVLALPDPLSFSFMGAGMWPVHRLICGPQ